MFDKDSSVVYDMVPTSIDYNIARQFRCMVVQMAMSEKVAKLETYENFSQNMKWLVETLSLYFDDPEAYKVREFTLEEQDLLDIAERVIEYDSSQEKTASLSDLIMFSEFAAIMLQDNTLPVIVEEPPASEKNEKDSKEDPKPTTH